VLYRARLVMTANGTAVVTDVICQSSNRTSFVDNLKAITSMRWSVGDGVMARARARIRVTVTVL
jgi:hypothetical protein